MHRILLSLVILGMAASLRAEDPSLGTWKLNIARSRLLQHPGGLPKEALIDIRKLHSGEFELTISSLQANGSKTSFKIVWPQEGGIARTPSDSHKDKFGIVTVIGPGEWYTTELESGKQIQFIHSSISRDGRTLRMWIKGAEEQGKVFEELAIYEKQ